MELDEEDNSDNYDTYLKIMGAMPDLSSDEEVKEAILASLESHPSPKPEMEEIADLDLYAKVKKVLHTLAESVQSLGARMDAVETPGRIPGRVQVHNTPSFIATAPFSFQQPSGSAPSASTGYAPGMCSGTTATAAPAVAPFAYSLATALPVQLQVPTGTQRCYVPGPLLPPPSMPLKRHPSILTLIFCRDPHPKSTCPRRQRPAIQGRGHPSKRF
ncbi:unnamed protein product [Boreogadus saida]